VIAGCFTLYLTNMFWRVSGCQWHVQWVFWTSQPWSELIYDDDPGFVGCLECVTGWTPWPLKMKVTHSFKTLGISIP